MATNDLNDGLYRPIRNGDQFDNPFPDWKMPSLWNAFKFSREKDNSNIPKEKILNDTLPIVKPNFNFGSDELSITWIGHSTVLVRIGGITLLTDPIFSERASPYQFMGPARYRKAAVSVDELPKIDAVVISHNHYDHLDSGSVDSLNKRFGSDLHWFVPLGLKQWMSQMGCRNVYEQDWWQQTCLPTKPDIQFILTPAQHWTRRGARDMRKSLWGSWTVITPKKRFFFAGDTGYCPAFKQIGQKFGPFDISAIPIGAYEPRWFMKAQHINPEEAVQIHEDIKSKFSVGIHWGTFRLTYEYYLEPPEKLKSSLKEHKLNENEFIALSHGQTKRL